MENQEIAKIFSEIAQYLYMKDVDFKPRAYEKAAAYIDSLSRDLRDIYEKEGREGLVELPTIGESIASQIIEYFRNGSIKGHQKLKEEIPVDIRGLTSIEGVGPKTVRRLYKELGVKDIKDLREAAEKNKIRELEGFGEKSEENILKEIGFYEEHQQRFLLGNILPKAELIKNKINNQTVVKKAVLAGSIRRREPTVGDVDILITSSNPEKAMDFFVSLPEVARVIGKGSTKSSIRTTENIDIDLRVVPEKSFGAAWQYFTGSRQHNIALRKIAIQQGMKLNEYGLFKGRKFMAGKTEESIYKKLGLQTPPPEIRRNQGEIEAAQKKNLPVLIKNEDLQGGLHCHTKWSDGLHSIREMAITARDKFGHQYLAITDHTKSLGIANGLDEEELLKQMKRIDQLNEEIEGITILKGCEANILKKGDIDVEEEVLNKLDIVVAGVHNHHHLDKKEMTKRILKAVQNPFVDIITHPTGRIIQRRDPYPVDWEKIFKEAVKSGTIFEINSSPDRLDFKSDYIRQAIKKGLKLSIGTDAHQVDSLSWYRFGINQARRGWATKKDIINTKSYSNLMSFLNNLH